MNSVNKKIPCLVYSRVVGYWSAVQYWNKGKRQEFKERRVYKPNAEPAKKPSG